MAIKINAYHPESVSHPSLTLVEKLKELGMGNKELSIRTDKPEKTISSLTKGTSAITSEMAVKLENVLKIPASFWLKKQRHYDEYIARLKLQEDITNAFDWAKKFPYAKMANLTWVPKTRKIEEKVIALFDFFGVSNHQAWKSYYYNQDLKLSFRISLAHTTEAMAISAWLRQGELYANSIQVSKYDSSALKKAIPKLKSLMAAHPPTFFEDLQKICKNVGLKVVYTPSLPKAPIHGATRWLGETPLIQLSARYKTNDKFWFTFFHELGHILLHGKKYISIENIKYDKQDLIKEKEADDFAIKYTFSKEEEKEVLAALPMPIDDVKKFAKKFNTHPALIIGRLHKKGLLPYYKGRSVIEGINLE